MLRGVDVRHTCTLQGAVLLPCTFILIGAALFLRLSCGVDFPLPDRFGRLERAKKGHNETKQPQAGEERPLAVTYFCELHCTMGRSQ